MVKGFPDPAGNGFATKRPSSADRLLKGMRQVLLAKRHVLRAFGFLSARVLLGSENAGSLWRSLSEHVSC